MCFIRTKLLLLDQRYLPQVLGVRKQGMFGRLYLSARLATGNFGQSGQHNLQAVLNRRQRDDTIGSFRVEEAGTERSLDSWAVW